MYQIRSVSREHTEIGEKIHSGQFMVSKYDEESDSEDTHQNGVKQTGYNFESSLLQKNFQFIDGGQTKDKLQIDESLNTMFQYLSIAMSGKITNPKWNSFKGVKFQPKDKIRLNNIIWREYHMQFVKKLKPVVVQFASPLSDSLQINGNVVLEGKYWKRRINIIVLQYKKWREYSKNRVTYEESKGAGLFDSILVQRSLYHKLYSNSPPPNLNDIFMDLDDLNLPIDDITGVQHNCQIIQPQLTNLQPRMESSIDFLNDYFCAPHKTMKHQKLFSSETCLNVSPQVVNTRTEPYFQRPSGPYLEHRGQRSAAMVQPKVEYAQTSSQTNNQNSISSILHPNHHNKSLSTEMGMCKTPNLLSILLQPLHSSTEMLQKQVHPAGTSMGNCQNKQSLVIATTSYGSQVSDPSATNAQPMAYDQMSQGATFKQSGRIKHSLTASNVVQQYLEEMSSLLMSSRDQNKISKAALLHKASEHIKRLRTEKHKLQSEIVSLQSEIDILQNRFSAFCSQLPATGVCLGNNKTSEGKRWFEDFVTKHSLTNWKFYVFSMMFESLFNGYNSSVSTRSMETVAHSVASWLEKECSLMKLRLIVINGMRTLSRRTSIVHSPINLEDEVKTLIETSSQTQRRADSAKWASFQAEPSDGRRQSDPPKPIRYRCTANPWPQMLTVHVKTSNSLDRQDV